MRLTLALSSLLSLTSRLSTSRALINDLLPFSRANPASPNYWGGMDLEDQIDEEHGGTIGFQPVKGEVVKSVVFSQWTKLLDRFALSLSSPLR